MKDYKRLTKWSELGTLHIFDFNGKEISLYDVTLLDYDNLARRLAELEDKIESGELVERDEVRKETAKKIIYRLRNLSHVGHLRSELDLLCREYCIEENKE